MTTFCRLELAAGRTAACPERACPFWEPGGAVLEGRCALDRIDLGERPEVAAELLGLRRQLESASVYEQERGVRLALRRLIDEADAD